MKNAIMVYPTGPTGIFNIGDYIQSIAARQFFDHIDTYVSRERLDEVTEPIRLIANGWYMHEPQHWPPADCVDPLFVALHINKLAEKELLAPQSIEYFKRHEPIGCRDFFTLQNLKAHGVDAYFSGCMTLTLGETYKRAEKPDDTIWFTDAYVYSSGAKFKAQCVKNLMIKLPLIRRIQQNRIACGIPTSLRSAAAFYTAYSSVFTDEVLANARFKTQQFHDFLHTDERKFEYADALLREYSRARFVVTTRIHCALPCLAMGVPVLFVNDSTLSPEHNCRLDGLIQLFNVIENTPEGLKTPLTVHGKIAPDTTLQNKPDYKQYAAALAARCRQFTAQPS